MCDIERELDAEQSAALRQLGELEVEMSEAHQPREPFPSRGHLLKTNCHEETLDKPLK